MRPPQVGEVLEAGARSLRAARVRRDLGVAIAIGAADLALLYAIDARLELHVSFRALALAGAAVAIARAVRRARRRSWRLPSRAEIARRWFSDSAADRDLVLSAADFADRGLGADSESADMHRLAISEAEGRVASLGRRRALAVPGERAAVALGTAALLVVTSTVALSPGGSALFARRTLFLSDTTYPRRNRIVVREPVGGLTVVRGADLVVEMEGSGGRLENVALLAREKGTEGVFQSISGEPLAPGRFAARLREVDCPLEVVAIGGDDRDLEPRVSVLLLVPPSVRAVLARVEPPGYTGALPRETAGGNVRGLAGSRVALKVTPSERVARGEVRFSWGSTSALVAGDEGSLETTFALDRAGSYSIQLYGVGGIEGRPTPPYPVAIDVDRPPVCSLDPPGYEGDVTPRAVVGIHGRARDDYGVSSAAIVLKAADLEVREDASIVGDAREVEIGRSVALADVGPPRPGDRIAVSLEARDTRPGEPQDARRHEFVLRVVSEVALQRRLLDEILGVKRRLDRPPERDALARDAGALARVRSALLENRVGGEGLARDVGLASAALSEAASTSDEQARDGAIQRARELLLGVGDLAEIALLARAIATEQAIAAQSIVELRDAAVRGEQLSDRGRAAETTERALASRVLALRSAIERESARYEGGRAPQSLASAGARLAEAQPQRVLVDVAESLARANAVFAAARALEAARLLEEIALILESPRERATPAARAGDAEDSSAGMSITEELRRLLEELDPRSGQAPPSGIAPDMDEILRQLEDLEEALEDAEKAARRSPSPPSKPDLAVGEAVNRAKAALEEGKQRLGRASASEQIELRREGFEATRDAIERLLEREARREPGVVERDPSSEARGQNLTGEYSAERLKPGSASALLPETTPVRAQRATRPWGDLPPRSPDDILRSGESGLPGGFEEALRAYYRALATPQ